LRADRISAFLAPVLRGSWLCVAAVLCGLGGDMMRPRGDCIQSGLWQPILLAALVLGAAGAAATVHHILRDRRGPTLVSTAVNLYAIAVTWMLITI